MMTLADNQLLLILACFLTGCFGTAHLFRRAGQGRAGPRAWRIADLVWVILGGFGAIAAILAGIYKADSSDLGRQIDVAYAQTAAFDRDAARFRLRFCDPPHGAEIAVLCDKVEFLSASTAGNAELPLFIAVTEETAPLSGLSFFSDRHSMQEMAEMAKDFDPDAFLVFTALDTPTQAAVDALRRKVPAIAGDFLILARSYDELIDHIARLKDEWEYLQAHAPILLVQIFALCLVAFAAPFRVGKSVVELRQGRD